MKFLNKFWLVAAVSVGLFSCGDSDIKKELADSNSKVDSLSTQLTKLASDSNIKETLLPDDYDREFSYTVAGFTMGDGGNVGDHNISVHMVQGASTLSVIKRTSATKVETVISFNLSTMSVKLSMSSGNIIVEPIALGLFYSQNHYLPISDKYDMKITPIYPFPSPASPGLAIVGAEDARDGVSGPIYTGDHFVYPLPAATAKMIIYQSSIGSAATTVRISTTANSPRTFYDNLPYCAGTSSTTGVKYWGLKFDKFCTTTP